MRGLPINFLIIVSQKFSFCVKLLFKLRKKSLNIWKVGKTVILLILLNLTFHNQGLISGSQRISLWLICDKMPIVMKQNGPCGYSWWFCVSVAPTKEFHSHYERFSLSRKVRQLSWNYWYWTKGSISNSNFCHFQRADFNNFDLRLG